VPVDISKEMLDLACSNIRKKFKEIACKTILLDLESGQFSDKVYEMRKKGTANLFLFLGSTLGNFSNINRVLSNFLESMSSNDFLIIGMELTNILKADQLIPNYTNKLVYNLLIYIPEKIGISRNDIEYLVTWNSNENRIEIKIHIKKDSEINIGEESFMLKKGEIILLNISVKFTEWTFTKLLSNSGFRTELLTTSRDRGYLLSMIQPTRYSI